MSDIRLHEIAKKYGIEIKDKEVIPSRPMPFSREEFMEATKRIMEEHKEVLKRLVKR